MSIRIASLPSSSPALLREAHAVFAIAFGISLATTYLLFMVGIVQALPAMAGLMLFAGFLVALRRRLAGYHPFSRLGAANRITLLRAGSACLIASRALDPAPLGATERWALAALAALALLLDGADGWAARRQGLASAFGARFDMETDAFAIAVLAVTVVKASAAPPWVLAIGAMRYLYLAARRLFPVLRLPLPECHFADRRRKCIAVIQSLALIAALPPVTPTGWATAACVLALGLLVYSFAADIAMQLVNRAHR